MFLFAPPQRTKFGPKRRLGIYVGFKSPSIIKYLKPLTCDILLHVLRTAILMRQSSRR